MKLLNTCENNYANTSKQSATKILQALSIKAKFCKNYKILRDHSSLCSFLASFSLTCLTTINIISLAQEIFQAKKSQSTHKKKLFITDSLNLETINKEFKYLFDIWILKLTWKINYLGGGYRSHFAKKKKKIPFTIHKEYNIGTSRFIENKTMHFGKSYFMATVGISIHEEKIFISHFMSNKKAESEVRKILITTFINVNHTYLQLRTTKEHQSLMY